MKLEEAKPILRKMIGVPFGELFEGNCYDLRNNKGKVGQLIERYIGLANSIDLTDFEDGELKSCKANQWGEAVQSMCITQISSIIDDLISDPTKRFKRSNLFKKIRNLLYLPIDKTSPNVLDWAIADCYHINLDKDEELLDALQTDYYFICEGLKKHLTQRDCMIHSTTGDFIQVRTKDYIDSTGSYHPIWSYTLGRYVSEKNYAFYFHKRFMNYVENA